VATLLETPEIVGMIGVIANPPEHAVVQEFFELFKTPWEFYRSERHYEVLIGCGDVTLPERLPKLLVLYGSQKLPIDAEHEIRLSSGQKEGRILSYDGMRIPIYGSSITFREGSNGHKGEEDSHQRETYLSRLQGSNLARIGYDLFGEIRTLLTTGQPAANAGIPTLELHIALLRNLILASGLSLVEIPPVPDGYSFIACLTHDVDHPSIRRHKLDHTILGYLYRAIFGSLVSVLQGRRRVRDLFINWWAALKLPLVQLGLARDSWSEFDHYPELERGVRSSFFVIPFKDTPGRAEMGIAPKRRASRYGAADIAGQIQALKSAGCEIGLHGIDAWIDSHKGFEELEAIRRVTGAKVSGVRMHWLYQNEESPVKLEKAGADYDSTVGYNQTIGYRAGTTQCYRPLKTCHLLELPLNIMDTALFFPAYLNLSPDEARQRVGRIIENTVRFGGSVTVNWHDRSIAPERLWGDFYVELIEELKSRGAWFSTASDAVSWFRKRRSAVFASVSGDLEALHVKIGISGNEGVPGMRLRIYNPGKPPQDTAISAMGSDHVHEISLNHGVARRM
jgi:peptidoglycan/xylan/chitin deacetylase (PgdA/CDA1 family)